MTYSDILMGHEVSMSDIERLIGIPVDIQNNWIKNGDCPLYIMKMLNMSLLWLKITREV